MARPTRWYTEPITPDLLVRCSVKEVLYRGRSPFQSIQVLRTGPFGLTLVLDGKTQSTEADEFIYHEALVHPALLLHPSPERAFVGGGGEGATLREVLAHRSIRRVVMVDIDREVIEVCRRFLLDHHQGAFDDPRLELHFQDAREYLANCREGFDAIVLDLADPIEGGPAYRLYTQEFYRIARERLRPGGLLVTQAGPAGPLNCGEAFTAIARTLASVFRWTVPYAVFVPSFGGPWGFVIASETPLPEELSPEEVDRLISLRLGRRLRFYDGLTHRHMFSLPRQLREKLERERRIVTDANPVFIV
jgi:spermidine synthase